MKPLLLAQKCSICVAVLIGINTNVLWTKPNEIFIWWVLLPTFSCITIARGYSDRCWKFKSQYSIIQNSEFVAIPLDKLFFHLTYTLLIQVFLIKITMAPDSRSVSYFPYPDTDKFVAHHVSCFSEVRGHTHAHYSQRRKAYQQS